MVTCAAGLGHVVGAVMLAIVKIRTIIASQQKLGIPMGLPFAPGPCLGLLAPKALLDHRGASATTEIRD